jgi:hypothetical protein
MTGSSLNERVMRITYWRDSGHGAMVLEERMRELTISFGELELLTCAKSVRFHEQFSYLSQTNSRGGKQSLRSGFAGPLCLF